MANPVPFPEPGISIRITVNEHGRSMREVEDYDRTVYRWMCSRAGSHLFGLWAASAPLPDAEALADWLDERALSEGRARIVHDYDADNEHRGQITMSSLDRMTTSAAEFMLDVFDPEAVRAFAQERARRPRRRKKTHTVADFLRLTGGRGTVADQVAATGWPEATVKRRRADLRRMARP